MTKSIPELKEELAAKQVACMHRIFDSQKESAEVSLDLDERSAAMLTKAQMGALWARERADWVREVRDTEKARYLLAEEEYAEAQRRRVQEIHETVFGATQEASVDQLQRLAEASEETLDMMLTMALQGDNEEVARQVLHAAWAREGCEKILDRWRQEVPGGDEDLDLLSELHEALSDEQLSERLSGDYFERVAPSAPTWESLQPQPGPPILGA